MTDTLLERAQTAPLPEIVSQALSNDTLARLLDQSLDCIKLISPDGKLRYMNRNGLCAMEIDTAPAVLGRDWVDLWPAETKPVLLDALDRAAQGEAVRFEAYCPTAKGTPRWWDVSVSTIRNEHGEVSGFLSTSRDVSEARRAMEVAEIASAEMRHRLKNSYAMVAGLLSSLARGLPEREEFASEVQTRLAALGVAQTLFASRENAPCELALLLPALLDPFGHGDCAVTATVSGDVSVEQGVADALALVIGELSVNSSKHGALSSAGTIRVTAEPHGSNVELCWSERSDRPVAAHHRDGGQGLRLMQRILKARHGEITLEWQDFGLDARIRVPASGSEANGA